MSHAWKLFELFLSGSPEEARLCLPALEPARRDKVAAIVLGMGPGSHQFRQLPTAIAAAIAGLASGQ